MSEPCEGHRTNQYNCATTELISGHPGPRALVYFNLLAPALSLFKIIVLLGEHAINKRNARSSLQVVQ